MKKNIMMRLSAILLVAVLLTTCVISGTWAKYVETKSVDDLATVANWGIEMTVTADKAVLDSDKTTKDATLSVLTNDLAAPGTYEKIEFAIEGTPEVAYEIKVEVSLELKNWLVESNEYCPLVFTVAGTEYKLDAAGTYKTIEALEEAIEDAVAKAIAGATVAEGTDAAEEGKGTYTVVYNAGTASDRSFVIDWFWAFEGDNAKDTALGNAATKATIDFDLTVTATQVDHVE